MTIHEIRTPLAPAEVIRRARSYFALGGTPDASFPEQTGEAHLRLQMEAGEVVVAAVRQGDATLVRGSASRGGHLLTGFLTTLSHPLDARQTTHRHGVRQVLGARVETFTPCAAAAVGTPSTPVAQAA